MEESEVVMVKMRDRMIARRAASRPLFPTFMLTAARSLPKSSTSRSLQSLRYKYHVSRIMPVDTSVPIYRGMKELDRDVFQKSVQILAAAVEPRLTNSIIRAPAMKGCVYCYLSVLLALIN